MNQPQVWITRSQPGAQRLAQHLEAAGYACLVAPVLDIVPLSLEQPLPQHIDVAVALSEHAVVHAPEALWAQAAQLVAVGAQTAHALARRGYAATHPTVASSEGLLAGPLAGIGSDQETVVLVSGRGGRTVLAERLGAAGARVTTAAVYARRAVIEVPQSLNRVGAIVVSSGDGFEAAGRLWFAASGPADVPVIAPSTRVAALAAQIGFQDSHNAGGADPESVLALLRNILTAL